MGSEQQKTQSTNAEIAGILTAISIIAKRLADNITELTKQSEVKRRARI